MTHPGGLALIYVARGGFFDSQSKAESPNKEISKVALSTLCTAPTTTHWAFAGLSALDLHDPPTIKCAKPHEAIKL